MKGMDFREWQTVQPEVKEKKEPRYNISVDTIEGMFSSRKARVEVIDTHTNKTVLEANVSTKNIEQYLEKVKSQYRQGGEGIKVVEKTNKLTN